MNILQYFKKKKKASLDKLESKELICPQHLDTNSVVDYISKCRLMIKHLEKELDEYQSCKKIGNLDKIVLYTDFWLKNGMEFDSVVFNNFNQKEINEIGDFIIQKAQQKIDFLEKEINSFQVIKQE